MQRGRAFEERLEDWVVWSRTRPKQKGEQVQVYSVAGKAVFAGKVRSAQGDQQTECADKLSDGELDVHWRRKKPETKCGKEGLQTKGMVEDRKHRHECMPSRHDGMGA